ncbi:hypothetical protein KY289_008041 [Solanum tuberosum]|nr:hypothetical protein KY289_008041 [Solanum tuberosum]
MEYEMRYSLRLEACAREQRVRVTLFDVAQILVLSKDKEFNFFVRIDMNNSNPQRSLIAQENMPLKMKQ